MANQKNASFVKRLGYAAKGIMAAWRREASFRFQCLCTFGLLVFCVAVRPSAIWCAVFTTNVVIVLALELINSAVEAILDRLHPEQHSEIGFVKDCLAGAVLIASIGSLIVFALFVFTRWT